eukprot:5994582-Prymnesium_polylepis.1
MRADPAGAMSRVLVDRQSNVLTHMERSTQLKPSHQRESRGRTTPPRDTGPGERDATSNDRPTVSTIVATSKEQMPLTGHDARAVCSVNRAPECGYFFESIAISHHHHVSLRYILYSLMKTNRMYSLSSKV